MLMTNLETNYFGSQNLVS